MSLVVIFFHGGVFERTVHAFDLPVAPGMVGFGQSMVDARFLADAVKDVEECVLIALPVGELHAVISQDGVDLVGYGGDQVAQEWRRNDLAGLWVQFGIGKLASAVDGHEPRELPFFGAHLGDIDVEVTDPVWRELLSGGFLAFGVRHATDAMSLQAVVV